jgi:hypothetical protein
VIAVAPLFPALTMSRQFCNCPSFIQMDFLEAYVSGCCHEASIIHMWGAVPYGQGDLVVSGYGLPEYQVDQTAYHTIAASEGAIKCGQHGTEIGSVRRGEFDVQDLHATVIYHADAHGGNELPLPPPRNHSGEAAPAQSIDMLVKDVRIWTCANWKGTLNTPGNACNGAVLTSAP